MEPYWPALSEGTVVHVLDLANGKEVRQLKSRPESLTAICFSCDSRTLAVGERDGSVTLWELASAQQRLRRKGHLNQVLSIAFAPNCTALATGGYDSTALIWDLTDGILCSQTASPRLSQKELEELWAESGRCGRSECRSGNLGLRSSTESGRPLSYRAAETGAAGGHRADKSSRRRS